MPRVQFPSPPAPPSLFHSTVGNVWNNHHHKCNHGISCFLAALISAKSKVAVRLLLSKLGTYLLSRFTRHRNPIVESPSPPRIVERNPTSKPRECPPLRKPTTLLEIPTGVPKQQNLSGVLGIDGDSSSGAAGDDGDDDVDGGNAKRRGAAVEMRADSGACHVANARTTATMRGARQTIIRERRFLRIDRHRGARGGVDVVSTGESSTAVAAMNIHGLCTAIVQRCMSKSIVRGGRRHRS